MGPGDAAQPAGQGVRVVELWQGAVGRQERLLGSVLGEFAVAEETVGVA